MQRPDSFEKILMLGKSKSRRRRGQQKMRWLDGITDLIWTLVWESSGSWWRTGKHGMLLSMGVTRVRHDWATELNWKDINLEYSLEGLMLKVQYFGHLIWRSGSLEKTLMLGKIEWDGWIASPTWWTWVWVSSGSWWWTGKPGVMQSVGLQRVRHD